MGGKALWFDLSDSDVLAKPKTEPFSTALQGKDGIISHFRSSLCIVIQGLNGLNGGGKKSLYTIRTSDHPLKLTKQ
jgi:hypothetical protein